MPMDGLTIGAVCAELNALLCGAKIDKINQPEEDELILLCRRDGKNHNYYSAQMQTLQESASLPLPNRIRWLHRLYACCFASICFPPASFLFPKKTMIAL